MTSDMFKTVPGLRLSTITASDLESLLESVRQFNIEKLQFTPGNQVAVSGVDESVFPELTDHLKRFMEPIEHTDITVLTCSGCGDCRSIRGDTSSIVQRVKNIRISESLPARCKVAFAGCARCCTMPFVRDLGIIPSAQGWTLIFGGNGGGKPRIGDVIAEQLSDNDLVEHVKKCLQIYCRFGSVKQRTARFIEVFGIEQFKAEIEKIL